MSILKKIKENGVDCIWVSKSLYHFMLIRKVSAYDDLITTLSQPKEKIYINLKDSLEKLISDVSCLSYSIIHSMGSECIALYQMRGDEVEYPNIKLEKNNPYSDTSNIKFICLLRQVGEFVLAFTLESAKINRTLDISYSETPYSFYITEIKNKNHNLRVNSIYFFSSESLSFQVVPIRELTLTDPEFIRENAVHSFSFDRATLFVDLVKVTDFEYHIEINYSHRYAYLKDEDFSSKSVYNFMEKTWRDSSYFAEKHNLK